MKLKKIGKLLRSKSVGTGPPSYGKRIYRAAVTQKLRNSASKEPIHNALTGKDIPFLTHIHNFFFTFLFESEF